MWKLVVFSHCFPWPPWLFTVHSPTHSEGKSEHLSWGKSRVEVDNQLFYMWWENIWCSLNCKEFNLLLWEPVFYRKTVLPEIMSQWVTQDICTVSIPRIFFWGAQNSQVFLPSLVAWMKLRALGGSSEGSYTQLAYMWPVLAAGAMEIKPLLFL